MPSSRRFARSLATSDSCSRLRSSDVVADAGAHPLVYVGAADAGGLALIVWPAGASAETVWLPALTEDALAAEVRAYRDAYQDYLNSPRTETDRAQWESAIDAVTAFAWIALMGPLLTALGTAPRVTLVPIGLLGVLPLHAAWTPDPVCATGRRYALDRTALTYAPNARALGAARTWHQEIKGEHLVAVDEPDLGAAGSRWPLPYSALEVAAAVATFGDHEVLSGREATADKRADRTSACPMLPPVLPWTGRPGESAECLRWPWPAASRLHCAMSSAGGCRRVWGYCRPARPPSRVMTFRMRSWPCPPGSSRPARRWRWRPCGQCRAPPRPC